MMSSKEVNSDVSYSRKSLDDEKADVSVVPTSSDDASSDVSYSPKSSDDVENGAESEYRIDFDVVLKEIGNLGRYQILLVLLAYWITIPAGFNQVASVFLAATPDYR